MEVPSEEEFPLDDLENGDRTGHRTDPEGIDPDRSSSRSCGGFLYSVEDIPPWHVCIFMAFQVFAVTSECREWEEKTIKVLIQS